MVDLSGVLENVRLNGFAERDPAAGEGLTVSSLEVGYDNVPGVKRIGSEGPRARVGVPEVVGGLLGGMRPDKLVFLCGGGGIENFGAGSLLEVEDVTVARGSAKGEEETRTLIWHCIY